MITGGSGLLGTELLKLRPDFIAPSRDELDISDAGAVSAYIADRQPDIVIHAAATTDNRDIESSPKAALSTNIIGTANLALACLGRRTRLVYLSTDYVYPGETGSYAESDGLQPGNLYAWSKLAGEAAVRAVPNHLIIRTSFGRSRFDYPGAFTDKYASKEYVDVVAPDILDAALSPLTGTLNLGGPRRSLYEYAVRRNPDVTELTLGESQHNTPVDTSLNLDRWMNYKNGEDILRPVDTCRVCEGSEFIRYLDLGVLPLANNLATTALEASQMPRFPLQVQVCTRCWLSQLTVVIDPRELFSNYAYRSSISQRYKDHCRAMAKTVGAMLDLGENDLVVDIAGNDGALLAEFKDELGVSVVNVDPAENLAKLAEAAGIATVTAFWSAEVGHDIVESHGRPKLITATNVFAHVDDVQGFVAAARDCLDDTGALMLEFPYGVDFIEKREFDTVYHEHLSYVLIEPLRQLAEQLGMDVFDVQKQDIHGGTVRVFMGKAGANAMQNSVTSFVSAEKNAGYHNAELYQAWSRDIDALIGDLRREIGALKDGGARVAAFAASAKGNTLLNACGFDNSTIDYIVDDTPEKIGRFSPGTGIPVVGRDRLAADPPDYLVILAWNFAKDIVASTTEYASGGGRYILPIPGYRVIESSDGETL